MGNRSTVQTVALAFGAIYLIVGILGFIGPLIGNGGSFITISQDKHTLLGIADVNLLDNLVHLVIGVAGLAAASTVTNARTYCQVFGVVLLLLGVLGIFAGNFLGVLPLGGGADIAIHLLSGAVLSYFGFAAPVDARAAA